MKVPKRVIPITDRTSPAMFPASARDGADVVFVGRCDALTVTESGF